MRHELRAPAVDRAEVAGERLGHGARSALAVAAQAREVELVQQRGIERDQLLALQAVDDVARRLARGRAPRAARVMAFRRRSAPP